MSGLTTTLLDNWKEVTVSTSNWNEEANNYGSHSPGTNNQSVSQNEHVKQQQYI